MTWGGARRCGLGDRAFRAVSLGCLYRVYRFRHHYPARRGYHWYPFNF